MALYQHTVFIIPVLLYYCTGQLATWVHAVTRSAGGTARAGGRPRVLPGRELHAQQCLSVAPHPMVRNRVRVLMCLGNHACTRLP